MPDISRRALYPLLLIAAGILLLVIAVVYIFINPGPADQNYTSNPSVDDTLEEVPRVTLSEAKRAFDTGSAVFVDVRDPANFESAHIPGALSIPLVEITSRIDELDPQDWIILYCT